MGISHGTSNVVVRIIHCSYDVGEMCACVVFFWVINNNFVAVSFCNPEGREQEGKKETLT